MVALGGKAGDLGVLGRVLGAGGGGRGPYGGDVLIERDALRRERGDGHDPGAAVSRPSMHHDSGVLVQVPVYVVHLAAA